MVSRLGFAKFHFMFAVASVLFFGLFSGLFGFTASQSFAALNSNAGLISKLPFEIETVTSTSVCGTSPTGGRTCLGTNQNEVTVNDTVSKLQHFILGPGHLCGVDERGVRCWGTQNRYEKSIQQILSSGDNKMVRFASEKVCLPQSDKTIHCYSAEQGVWVESQNGSGSRYVRNIPAQEVYGPYIDLRDFQLTSESICALDGEHVRCEKFKSNANSNRVEFETPTRAFPNAKALSVSWDSLCVLYQDGVDCTRESKELLRTFKLRGSWANATTLFSIGSNSICAVDANHQPMCAKLGSDNDELTDSLPPEIQDPDLAVLKFKADGDTKCALVRKKSDGLKKFMCGTYSAMTVVENMNDVSDFEVQRDRICALGENGVVSCFMYSSNLESPLPEDGSQPHTAGKCRWNDSRFHCSTTETSVDFSDVRRVLGATQNSSDLPLPCIIFENRAGIRGVKCFSASAAIEGDVPPLDSENIHIEASYSYACVYGGPNTKCWGDPLGSVAAPNLGSVKRILFSRDFGCATDQFGFLCWGFQLEERNLLTPVGLRDFDSVSDFALGANHICAITRDNRVECWGDDRAGQLRIPQLTNPTSIAASGDTTCASSDEGITCWGAREDALLGSGETKKSSATETQK